MHILYIVLILLNGFLIATETSSSQDVTLTDVDEFSSPDVTLTDVDEYSSSPFADGETLFKATRFSAVHPLEYYEALQLVDYHLKSIFVELADDKYRIITPDHGTNSFYSSVAYGYFRLMQTAPAKVRQSLMETIFGYFRHIQILFELSPGTKSLTFPEIFRISVDIEDLDLDVEFSRRGRNGEVVADQIMLYFRQLHLALLYESEIARLKTLFEKRGVVVGDGVISDSKVKEQIHKYIHNSEFWVPLDTKDMVETMAKALEIDIVLLEFGHSDEEIEDFFIKKMSDKTVRLMFDDMDNVFSLIVRQH
ncbi:hypothetical protein NEOLI_001547 [Neolecta irregularis DAH-3]|uniref:Uncharacterized protein n=1 Tax=Neolecta irregularis (strain DAH-3) TaxID=1198029 RepID=A0A1U7LI01_NEOID|nr:hypothetical protein NEOLI_001547 [Neolecta irregularis DAH-3]|eukprot:OLL22286.1 hypothetical protein NEOLI_001547 [Neolecta irregularis DAH-3]